MAAAVGQKLEVSTKKHEIDLEVVGEQLRVLIIIFVTSSNKACMTIIGIIFQQVNKYIMKRI